MLGIFQVRLSWTTCLNASLHSLCAECFVTISVILMMSKYSFRELVNQNKHESTQEGSSWHSAKFIVSKGES